MAAILDIMISFVFSGLLLVMGMKLNVYVSSYQQQCVVDLNAQQNCVELGRILENDFYKIGYGDTTGRGSMRIADSTKIRFYADIDNNGSTDSITYYTAKMVTKSKFANPHQMYLYRQVNTLTPVKMNLGLTNLRIQYFNLTGAKVDTLGQIQALKVSLDIESNAKMVNSGGKDTVYNKVHWEQYIVPKSLSGHY